MVRFINIKPDVEQVITCMSLIEVCKATKEVIKEEQNSPFLFTLYKDLERFNEELKDLICSN